MFYYLFCGSGWEEAGRRLGFINPVPVRFSSWFQELKLQTVFMFSDDTRMEDMSQDLFDCDSETPDLLLQHLPPPPPPPWTDSLLLHSHFLQSVCSLQRLDSSSRALDDLCLTPGCDGGSAVAETVSLLLDCVVASCRDPPAPGLPDPLPRACQVASRALDVLCSPGRPSVEVTRRVEEALRALTQTLLGSKRPGRVSNV